MAEELDLNTAWELAIKGVYEGNSFEIPLARFSDDLMAVPENWQNVPWAFAISEDPNGGDDNANVLMKLTTTDGQIVLSTNMMTISCKDVENKMISKGKTAKTYYYDLIADLGSGVTRIEGKGTIEVNPSVGK